MHCKCIFSRYGMRSLCSGVLKVWGLQWVLPCSLGSTHEYLSFKYMKGFFAVQGQSTANLVCIAVHFLLSELQCNF